LAGRWCAWYGELAAGQLGLQAQALARQFVVTGWPFVSGVWLVLIGVMQIVQAFQIRKDVKAARQKLDAASEPVAARDRYAGPARPLDMASSLAATRVDRDRVAKGRCHAVAPCHSRQQQCRPSSSSENNCRGPVGT